MTQCLLSKCPTYPLALTSRPGLHQARVTLSRVAIEIKIDINLFDWSLQMNAFNPSLNNSKSSRQINNVNSGLVCSGINVPIKTKNTIVLSTVISLS